jgi:hypothetical protein
MARRYLTRFTMSLAVLAVTVLLQAGPALAQQCREHVIIDRYGNRTVCEICCWQNGDCETRCR